MKRNAPSPGGRRGGLALTVFLLGLALLLLGTATVPAFQEEKAVADALRRAASRTAGLERLRRSYRQQAQAVGQDPQEALRFWLDLEDEGLAR